MRQELTKPRARQKRTENETRVMGIDWIDSKKPGPISIEVLDRAGASRTARKTFRESRGNGLVLPTPGDFISLCYWAGVFGWYCLGSIGCAMGLQRSHRHHWKNSRRLSGLIGLVLLSAAAIEFVGCVGYVGPDGGGVYGPVVETPGVFVVGGGYHGHYAGAWGHRGAVSRGWHR